MSSKEHHFVGRKHIILPDPEFKKSKVFIDDEINDIMPPPQKIAKKEAEPEQSIPLPRRTIHDIINHTPSSNITLIYKNQLLCQFTSVYNFISRSVFEISQVKDVEAIKQVKLCCADVEHTGKMISKQGEDHPFFVNTVGIIENTMNEVYLIFPNKNVFDWAIYTNSENEYVMYKVTNLQKIQLITDKPLDYRMINKPFFGMKRDGDEGKVAISQLEFKSAYNKLVELKIEVPLEKKRYEDRLMTHEKNLENIKAKVANPDSQKKIIDLKDRIKRSLHELECLKEKYKQSQVLYDSTIKKLECQQDIFTKISMKVIEEKTFFDNERQLTDIYNEEIEGIRKSIQASYTQLKEKEQLLEKLQSKTIIHTIDGCVFEEIPIPLSKINMTKEDEYKLGALEEQVERIKCIICYQNYRNCLFDSCSHLTCCTACIIKNTGDRIKKASFKKNSKELKGTIICPDCNKASTKCFIVQPNC